MGFLDVVTAVNSFTAPSSLDLVLNVMKLYAERAQSARERHAHADAQDPFEVRRSGVLGRIADLQTQVVVFPAQPRNTFSLGLFEAEVVALEATSELELSYVEARLRNLQVPITAIQNQLRDRARARKYAVYVALGSLIFLGAFLWYAAKFGVTKATTIELLGLPVPVLLWSAIGSFAAILYRFSNARDSDLIDPLKWLFSRPLTGVVMGAIAYMAFRVGLMTLVPHGAAGQSPVSVTLSDETLWLLSFVAGFSDRFSEGLLRALSGRAGVPSEGDLVTLETSQGDLQATGAAPISETITKLRQGAADFFGRRRIASETLEPRSTVASPPAQSSETPRPVIAATNPAPPPPAAATTTTDDNGKKASRSEGAETADLSAKQSATAVADVGTYDRRSTERPMNPPEKNESS